jgi:polyisoprenyl-phosphate glycosyltransferase
MPDAPTKPPGAPPLGMSVVVPVYGNEATLPDLVDRLVGMSHRLPEPLEAVFVVDGSPDGSGRMLERLLAEHRLESQLLWHARNFGAFPAIRTGLSHARGRIIAVMAADLQEPVELVEAFYRELASDEHDVAVGLRRSRQDPALSKAASAVFWSTYRRFVQRAMPEGGVDVFACTAQVRTALCQLGESHTSLVGLLMWLGYRRIEVPYDRAPRSSGTSGWTFRRKARYLLDSVYSFTDLPITLLLFIGVSGILLSVAANTAVLVAWLAGAIEVAGYTPLMLAILTVGFLLLSAIGIVGSYVWRTYENSKGRPPAVVLRHEVFPRA